MLVLKHSAELLKALRENQELSREFEKLGRALEKLGRMFKKLDRVFVLQYGPCCPNQPRYFWESNLFAKSFGAWDYS